MPTRLREYALKLNDSIVQGLAAAKMALELGQVERAERMIDDTLTQAQAIISELLREVDPELHPGDLVRGDKGGADAS